MSIMSYPLECRHGRHEGGQRWCSHRMCSYMDTGGCGRRALAVFHLHNTSTTHKLSVYLDGQRLWDECHPTYLWVTLDRMQSYREHLTKTAGKLKNRNNLLMKLELVPPGALAPTLCSHLLWRFAIQQQSTAPQSGHALLTQVRSMCS